MERKGRRRERLSSLDAYLHAKPLHYGNPREEERAMVCRLKELVSGFPVKTLRLPGIDIRGVVCDSRKVRPGYLFVAVPGTAQDGHAYIPEAVSRGAAAVVCQRGYSVDADVPTIRVPSCRKAMAELAARFHGRPTERLNVIGITGTNGKSTTAYLLRSILEAAGSRTGLLGTVEYMLGDRSIPAPVTTPGADDLQEYFHRMVDAGCQSAVMEVSSHALDQGRVHGIRFAGGVFTNLTRDHMDYHKTMARYRKAKGRLFGMLEKRNIAVLNADDPASEGYAAATDARVVRYGLNADADLYAELVTSTLDGTQVRFHFGSEVIPVQLRLVGEHNVYNALAAASVAWSMGYDFEPIRAGLEAFECMPGRLEPVRRGQPFSVLVDYAHTDDALKNVLQALRPMVRGRILTVFGCGGDRDRGKRPKMGRVAAKMSDLSVLTSDNPRGEQVLDIIREIEQGMPARSRYLIEPDRASAIALALRLARPGDAVLLAGKGHESKQIFRDGVRPFSDVEVARGALGRLGYDPD